MKKTTMVVVLFVCIFSFFTSASASAEQKVVLENGELVVSEVKTKVVMRVPNVPVGISAEDAHKIVIGGIKEVMVKGEKEKEIYSFSYPIRKIKIFSDGVVSYSAGKWNERMVPRVEESSDWLLTISWLLIAFSVLIFSLENQLTKLGDRKLFVFYIVMFISIITAMIVGGITSMIANVIVGEVMGLLIGVAIGVTVSIVGIFKGEFADKIANTTIVGMFAGGFAGGQAGMLAGRQQYRIAMSYLLFMVMAMLVSFLIARASRAIKDHLPAIKAWVMEK
jgi:hypothetical protein